MNASPLMFKGKVEEPTFNRVQRALLPWCFRWYLTVPLVMVFFVSSGSGWETLLQSPANALPDLLYGLVVLTACWVILRFGRQRTWKNYVHLHGSVSGQLSSDGLEWKTETTTTSMPWTKISGHRLSADLALLYYSPRCAFFLPRQFFATDEDWERLEELVQAHSRPL